MWVCISYAILFLRAYYTLFKFGATSLPSLSPSHFITTHLGTNILANIHRTQTSRKLQTREFMWASAVLQTWKMFDGLKSYKIMKTLSLFRYFYCIVDFRFAISHSYVTSFSFLALLLTAIAKSYILLQFRSILCLFLLQYDIWKWISYWINARTIFVRRIFTIWHHSK